MIAPGGVPFGEGDADDVEPTFAARLSEGVELGPVSSDPLSAVDKL